MTLSPGDKIISIMTNTGRILVPTSSLTPADKVVSIPTKTGRAVVPVVALAPGDKIVSVPSMTGKILIKVGGTTPLGILLMGGVNGSCLNDIWKSVNNGQTWTQLVANAEWAARYGHACVVMSDGSIILTGGFDGGNYMNDTWISTDKGLSWTQQSASANWTGRWNHRICRLSDDTLILTGGASSGNEGLQDVYRSTNLGVTWTQIVSSAPWYRRNAHGMLAMADDSIVLFAGGYGTPFFLSDTWRSTDKGANWTQLKADDNIPYIRRTQFSSVRSGSNLIMMGGLKGERPGLSYGGTNEVWVSSDNGINWTKLAAPGWSARIGHSSVISGGNIILTGGETYSTSSPLGDVWRSMDGGSSWSLINATPGWSARFFHACVVLT